MATVNDSTMADAAQAPLGVSDYSDLLQTPHCNAFTFSDTEALALELYDQLRELEVQASLVEAQTGGTSCLCVSDSTNVVPEHVPDVSGLSDDDVQEQLATAQRELMEAQAKFAIRNRISHNVLVMDPVVKAVHGGEITDYAEKWVERYPFWP
jgi:hypothetical protein